MKKHHSLRTAVVAAVPVISGVSLACAGDLQFSEKAAAVGLTGGFDSANGFGLQFMIAGAGVGDFDRDGDQDILVLGGSTGTDHLYINDGTGNFTDQAAAWGVDASGYRHSGVAVGDYNNDGWLDIYVTSIVESESPVPAENRLYRNNGDNTFTDVADIAGVRFIASILNDSFSSAFGDPDLDGDLDLFVTGWYGGNHLYTNNGDGTFTVEPNSIFNGDVMDLIRGFSVRFLDINEDGWPDILLTADFFTSRVFINNADGTYTNATVSWGAGLDSNGMGSAQGDFNNDGLIDWYVASLISEDKTDGTGSMLYMNNGDSTFTESSVGAGVNFGFWGWGADAVDFNHDGWLDIAATNGWNGPFFSTDPTRLWLNNQSPEGGFIEASTKVGIADSGQGRGLLTFDADNDGDRDLLIANNNQSLVYFENSLSGDDVNAITFFFDTSGEPALAPDGFGVTVELDANGITQSRVMDGGATYLSQSELSTHFGMAAAPVADEVRITWPNGTTTTLVNVLPGRYTITANFGCPADWNADDVLDLSDISGWIDGFQNGHPQADLTGDGIRDLSDIQQFIDQFLGGCL